MNEDKTIFEQLKVGMRLKDEHDLCGTVQCVYPNRPVKGAIIAWDNDLRSWPTDVQINKMKILKQEIE